MLNDTDKQRIYEEETLRQQLRGTSSTDQLSNCISWGCAAVVVTSCVIGFLFFCFAMSGLFSLTH